jgi:hypothetical protein
MAELEIHHEIEGEQDPMGKKVGILAAVLAVILALVTILSHRTHTEAVLLKAQANDNWQHYQSVRVKFHSVELSHDLLEVLGSKAQAEASTPRFEKDLAKYDRDAKEIQKDAREKGEEAEQAETHGLRFDLGEGLLEISLVLSSLYFIARRMLFPIVSVVAGIAGTVVALTGLLG